MTNPLLAPWTGPFEAPPFSEIRVDHFRSAFAAGVDALRADVAGIADDPAAPTFDNTIVALERVGRELDRVSDVFFNLVHADGDDEMQAIETEMAPVLARETSALHQNAKLFARIEALYVRRSELALNAEQLRLLERRHLSFVRDGAALAAPEKARLAAIDERLAELQTRFGQNVLADEKAYALTLETPEDRAGLSESFLAGAAESGADRGLPGKHIVTLSRPVYEAFQAQSTRRDLREKTFRAFVARGANPGEHNNGALMAETLQLRGERARLLGYESFAHYRLADSMARTPEAATGLLEQVWKPAKAKASRDAEALQAMIATEGGNFDLAPWDWRFYAEKRRKAEFDFDGAEIKPYLALDDMRAAAFYVAGRLFGLHFVERKDISTYRADVRAFEVRGADGKARALFFADDFARSSKRSGAWMSSYRVQSKLDGEVLPIVVNVNNFAKPGESEACLLSLDDARTLFHEFGHALHGMLSNVTYPTLSGTHVRRDFVEFPSQLYEHWFETPEILSRFARHHKTGEPLPQAMVERVVAARKADQGFATVEFAASAFVDMALHRATSGDVDALSVQAAELKRLGMPEAIAVRHAAPHFQHVFSGGYSAAYYSYLWSEILDSDGFEAFVEAGDVFDPEVAGKLKEFVYSAGDVRPPDEAYAKFRGRAPRTEALLRKRGFAA